MSEGTIRLIFLALALYVIVMIAVVFLGLLPMYVPLSEVLSSNPITVYPEGVAKVNPTLKVLEATIAAAWSTHGILGFRRFLSDLAKTERAMRAVNWLTVALLVVLVPIVIYAIMII
ncbi:MAG: succinate dehydrogenase [Thermoproteus sp. AZ2]|jgi:putative succinate dehydrogenase/fumarate reductase subunit D|uniref:Succinate dehydrogenase n=1 Tax=Thermoproteus sp. AZ2 TaxID=1609232 RepID=A0ACC6V3M6_9CREN|nr:MAG: succinate dehydrogenase [Thermoproteus sp. AZ2]